MSIAGGLDKALERGASIGCETIQVFTKSSNQWRERYLSDEEVARFKARQAELDIHPVVAHDAYLINLASPDDALWTRSLEAMVQELERCEALDIPGLVMHPGSHKGAGEEAGLRRVTDGLNELFRRLPGYRVQVWVETTSGQGRTLGHRFEHLGRILELVHESDRLGFCFDTAHVFSAGYDLRTPAAYEATLQEFDHWAGLGRLRAFHLNDSKRAFGSGGDRHQHIGKGSLGLEPFRYLLNDVRFVDRPMLFETPKGKDLQEDAMNLRVLRGLIEGRGGDT